MHAHMRLTPFVRACAPETLSRRLFRDRSQSLVFRMRRLGGWCLAFVYWRSLKVESTWSQMVPFLLFFRGIPMCEVLHVMHETEYAVTRNSFSLIFSPRVHLRRWSTVNVLCMLACGGLLWNSK